MFNSIGEVLSNVLAYVLDLFWQIVSYFCNFILDGIWAVAEWAGLRSVVVGFGEEVVAMKVHFNNVLIYIMDFNTVFEAWGIPVTPVAVLLGFYLGFAMAFIAAKIVLKLIPTIG